MRRGRREFAAPPAHPTGARPPAIPADLLPRHVALVMDGNGRWANQRGLPRTKGHEAGEAALLDVIRGAIELGIGTLSAYAFPTENWRRSPDEVRFLMGFNREVIRRRRNELPRTAGRPARPPRTRSRSRWSARCCRATGTPRTPAVRRPAARRAAWSPPTCSGTSNEACIPSRLWKECDHPDTLC